MSTLNYSTFVSDISTLTAILTTDPNFVAILPAAIDYAEQRLYREGDFLATYITDTSTTVVANQRIFNYPTGTGTFLVIDQINILTPLAATSSNATRVPLQVASKQFIDLVYPNNSSGTGVPKYFAPATATYATLGPVPDQAYNVEVIGTQRPASLSAANSSTFLTKTLPDLFVAAAMVFMTGYTKNYGAQSDNPQASQSWENQYQQLFASAGMEEARKKYQSQGWQSQIPAPIATPARV